MPKLRTRKLGTPFTRRIRMGLAALFHRVRKWLSYAPVEVQINAGLHKGCYGHIVATYTDGSLIELSGTQQRLFVRRGRFTRVES